MLLSALLHDAGMWTTREDANALRTDQDFKKYCSRHFEGKLDEVERELSSTGREWLGRLGLQLLAASYNRGKHAERLGSFVFNESKNSPSPTGQTLRILVGIDFVEAVATVSVAHSWDRKKVLEDDSLRPREFGGNGDLVDLRFLAILLRLGDLLDLGEGRISSLMWDYLRPLNPVSEAHWRKESKLKVNRCEPDRIEISGHFDIDSGGIKEREAYRLATDWLEWLEEEILSAHHYLRIMESQFSHRLKLGTLHFDKSRVIAEGLADEGHVSFELDRQRIMQLLGDEIYSDGCVFVRELLQNAVDATRAQMVRDYKQQIDRHDPLYPPDNPWHWPHEVTERYTITVNTGKEIIAEKEYLTFSIADPGIGMSLKQIRKYFLQIGISYYKTDEFREEFMFPSISNFGIGFLSCLMVADKIEVITRTHDEPKGLRLSIQSPSDHFLVERVEDSAGEAPGTQVKLWIDPDKPRAENWDAMPIQKKMVQKALGFSNTENRDFTKALKQWGLFIEFPIFINKELYSAHRSNEISLIPNILSHLEFRNTESVIQSVNLNLLSPFRKSIADGRLAFHTIKPSGIPFLRLTWHSFFLHEDLDIIASNRGMYLSGNHSDNILLVLNFNRLPQQAMTVGRQLRKDFPIIRLAAQKISENLIAKVMQHLKAYSTEISSLWRLTLNSFSVAHDFPFLLPCRTTDSLEWLTPQEAVQKHNRIVLVPFGIAWREIWNLEVPCLGILNSNMYYNAETERIDINNLNDTRLISIEGKCTGYLWPKDADDTGLQLVNSKMTFLHDGLVALTRKNKKCKTGHFKIDNRMVKPSEMPKYDCKGNPWYKFGLHDYYTILQETDIDKIALKLLSEIPPLSFENTEFEIILDDTEDWE